MEHLTTYITILSYVIIAVIVFKISLKVVSKANFIKEGDRSEIAFSMSIIWPMTLCCVFVFFLYLAVSKLLVRYGKKEID